MLLKFDVIDSTQTLVGKTAINLDWKRHQWSVGEDKAHAWNHVSASRSGTFDFKDWDVIWLWDKARNVAIIWDAPKNATDYSTKNGQARLYDPADPNYKDNVINWTIDVPASAAAAARATYLATLPLRPRLMAILRDVLPCTYNDEKYKRIAPGLTKQGGNYTTCGSLPGFVSSELGGRPLGKGWDTYMKTRSLNGTNIVREKGIKYGAWVQGDPGKRPKPGDIYALLNWEKTDRLKDGISHVGVIIDSTGETWKTADMGQGTGYDGKIDTPRSYKPGTSELWGESNQGGGYRYLAGWIDIEKYFS
jgi:hypothetical protein